MLLMSVIDVVFTMVPDVTNMALSYCECGLSIAKSIPGMLGRMSSGLSVSLLHAYYSSLESVSKISDELLFRC